MSTILKRWVGHNEFWVAATTIVLSIVIGSVNPAFWSLMNLCDLLRSATVAGLFALGAHMVLISGGIDISFTAIAAVSFYATTKLLVGVGYQGPMVWIFLLAASAGALLGFVNALFIAAAELPPFIVTLGTQNLYRGFLLAFIGSNHISNLPQAMVAFSRWDLFRGTSGSGIVYGLPGAVLFLLAAALLVSWLLNRTLIGRGIYALGGDAASAERVGFNLAAIRCFTYVLAGALAGLTGIVHCSLSRIANPFDLVGSELNILAAVVLGGARISGGYGTVTGTLMGVGLLSIMTNSLILMGVPSYWQRVVAGLMILTGIGLPALKRLLRAGRARGVASNV